MWELRGFKEHKKTAERKDQFHAQMTFFWLHFSFFSRGKESRQSYLWQLPKNVFAAAQAGQRVRTGRSQKHPQTSSLLHLWIHIINLQLSFVRECVLFLKVLYHHLKAATIWNILSTLALKAQSQLDLDSSVWDTTCQIHRCPDQLNEKQKLPHFACKIQRWHNALVSQVIMGTWICSKLKWWQKYVGQLF